MAKHKLNPEPGDIYFHPKTFNAYSIHSITDDGWVRFHILDVAGNVCNFTPLWTMPTLDFIGKYKRQEAQANV